MYFRVKYFTYKRKITIYRTKYQLNVCYGRRDTGSAVVVGMHLLAGSLGFEPQTCPYQPTLATQFLPSDFQQILMRI